MLSRGYFERQIQFLIALHNKFLNITLIAIIIMIDSKSIKPSLFPIINPIITHIKMIIGSIIPILTYNLYKLRTYNTQNNNMITRINNLHMLNNLLLW